MSCRDRGCLGKILVFSPRSHLSRRISPRWKTQPQSRRDLAQVFRPLKISPRSRLPRRDPGDPARLPRRDLAESFAL